MHMQHPPLTKLKKSHNYTTHVPLPEALPTKGGEGWGVGTVWAYICVMSLWGTLDVLFDRRGGVWAGTGSALGGFAGC